MPATLPLDPLDFLAIAREITSGRSYAHLRTALSRAYYG
jgi:hypothetical protein